jgi:Fe-S cluster assembly protein SufD
MSTVSAPGVAADRYRAAFARSAQAGGEPSWLGERRRAAFERFAAKGLPAPRDESWRHTPLAPLVRVAWEPADPVARPAREALAAVPAGGARGVRVVLVNGRLVPELSRLDAAGAAVSVASLRDLLASRPQELEPWLGRIADGATGAFADLNTALAEDAAVVRVAPGAVLDEAIRVDHVGAADAGHMACSRTLFVAGRGSESRLVESFVSTPGRAALANVVTELALEDGARVERVKLQQEGEDALHVATLAVRLGRDARFFDHSLVLGAALSRDDIDVRFEGEGGECALYGLFVVDGHRVADTHSRVDHAKPRCASRELYKGILDDEARGVFAGLVVVRPGAQKTDAWQMNRNLLLSPRALVHSTPQLEILADDVKCKHGSTTGQLDPGALFYLRSRGIGEPAARALLTWAFASEVLLRVRDGAARAAVEARLRARLPELAGLAEAGA